MTASTQIAHIPVIAAHTKRLAVLIFWLDHDENFILLLDILYAITMQSLDVESVALSKRGIPRSLSPIPCEINLRKIRYRLAVDQHNRYSITKTVFIILMTYDLPGLKSKYEYVSIVAPLLLLDSAIVAIMASVWCDIYVSGNF